MLSQIPKSLSLFHNPSIPNSNSPTLRFSTPNPSLSLAHLPPFSCCRSTLVAMASASDLPNAVVPLPPGVDESELDRFATVANKVADASGEVIRNYFRQKFDILDKEDSSPVTIADQTAEEHMISVISQNFPSHAVYGEENGWRCKETYADYVWVLDPIDGTKSFITGKPVFGTLISLLLRGKPILGIIDQPILRERWLGVSGRKTTLNGKVASTRKCANLAQAYLYTTSPHLFSAEAEEAFIRVRNKPYDFLSLIPVIEGSGGVITDWKGHQLLWEASANSHATSFNVVAAGDKQIHQQALNSLQWQ